MKIRELTDFDEKDKWLKITDLENMFDIYEDKNGKLFYNLNNGLYVSVADSTLLDFTCDHTMYWTLISYKIYGTTRLAWLLMKLNNVDAKDVFKMKQPSEVIKYLKPEDMQGLIATMNEFDD